MAVGGLLSKCRVARISRTQQKQQQRIKATQHKTFIQINAQHIYPIAQIYSIGIILPSAAAPNQKPRNIYCAHHDEDDDAQRTTTTATFNRHHQRDRQ